MAFNCKPLWKLLIDREMTKKQLMEAGYKTKRGQWITGDRIEVFAGMEDNSINLIITPPQFGNQREK